MKERGINGAQVQSLGGALSATLTDIYCPGKHREINGESASLLSRVGMEQGLFTMCKKEGLFFNNEIEMS